MPESYAHVDSVRQLPHHEYVADQPNNVRISRPDDVTAFIEVTGVEQLVDGKPYIRAVVSKRQWHRVIRQALNDEVRVGPVGQEMGALHDVVEIHDPPEDSLEGTIWGEPAIVVRTCRKP